VITGKYHTSIKLKQKLHCAKSFSFNKIPGHCVKTGAGGGTVETGVNVSQQLDYHTTWPTNTKWILARFSELLDSLFPHFWM